MISITFYKQKLWPQSSTIGVLIFGSSAARDIKIIKQLHDLEVTEKESAAFVCEVSHDEVEGQWFKDDVRLKAGDNIKMRQEGELGFALTIPDSDKPKGVD